MDDRPYFYYPTAFFDWDVTPTAPSIDNDVDDSWDDMSNAQGDIVSVPVDASDPDNRNLLLTATGLPPGLSIDPHFGTIVGTVDAGDDTGQPYDVVVSVSNGYHTSKLEFPWAITRIEFPTPADQFDTDGDTVSLPIQATDQLGKPLKFSADGLPDGLSIDPSSGVISGVIDPSADDGQPWAVTIDVTDGDEDVERTFNWTVHPATLPTFTVTDPGDQTDLTTDVIALPIQASDTGADPLSFAATGLPTGLSIDPDTGLISGMDDDSNAPDDTTYDVTITATDEYGTAVSVAFLWHFLPGAPVTLLPIGGQGGSSETPITADLNSITPDGAPIGAQHPATESRTDNFSIDGFWSNVEKLPGGQAAEDWFAGKNGRVEWAYFGVYTYGRNETQADGSKIPVMYIPQRYNEADASTAFVDNVTKSWVTGFAGEALLPTNGDPTDWQEYIRQRTAAQGAVVVAGAELYLSALSIVSEGADFVVTLNDVATAKDFTSAAIASVGLLPFISNGAIKIVQAGKTVLNISPGQRRFLDFYLSETKQAGVTYRVSGVGGAASAATDLLQELKNVRNYSKAILQPSNDTCGIWVGLSIIDKFKPNFDVAFNGIFNTIRQNLRVRKVVGLHQTEVANFLRDNLGDVADIALKRNVKAANYQQMFSQGNVVALVDGGHWVEVTGIVPDGGKTWVQVYDPARGNYEQLLNDFSARCGVQNFFITVNSAN